jgi:hypothetical protein
MGSAGGELSVVGSFFSCLLLRRLGQLLLDSSRQLVLVFRSHECVPARNLKIMVTSDPEGLDRAAADLLPPRDAGAVERVRPEAGEVAAFVLGGLVGKPARPLFNRRVDRASWRSRSKTQAAAVGSGGADFLATADAHSPQGEPRLPGSCLTKSAAPAPHARPGAKVLQRPAPVHS